MLRPAYKSTEPLIFMHIPKCGGVSVAQVLRNWFQPRYAYARAEGYPDLTADSRIVGGDSCIRAHFNLRRGELARTYPGARQIFTLVRDPFELAVSYYFYGKSHEKPANAKNFSTVDEYLDYHIYKKKGDILFPWLLPRSPYESLSLYCSRFLIIGTTDRLQRTMDILADLLGKPRQRVGTRNRTKRTGHVPDRRAEFRAKFQTDYKLYDMALEAIDAGQPLGWACRPTALQRIGLAKGATLIPARAPAG